MKLPRSHVNFHSFRAPRRWVIAGACLAGTLGTWLFLRPDGRDSLTERVASATAKLQRDRAGDPAETLATTPFSPLWQTLPPRAFETVSERVLAEVEEKVTASGYAVSATEIAKGYVGSREEQRIALEAVISEWAVKDRPAASMWMEQHTGHINESFSTLEHGLWEAALGGYINGVVENDPESAVIGAGLLQPPTPIQIGNAQNRTLLPDAPEVGSGYRGPAEMPAISGVATPSEGSVDDGGTTVTSTDSFSASERRRLFPGDPGFPGDPDFLSPLR